MAYSTISLLLLAIALALLCAEFFIPSGGMILGAAILCFLGSVWCAWQEWGKEPSKQVEWWSYIVSVVLLIPTVVGGALYLFPRTSFGRRVLLEAPSLDEVTPHAEDAARLSQLVGKRGKTLTLLTPGGLVQADGERMHCESEGMLIDPGQEVDIVAVKGNRLVVRLAGNRDESAEAAGDGLRRKTEPNGDSRLDFDIPQS